MSNYSLGYLAHINKVDKSGARLLAYLVAGPDVIYNYSQRHSFIHFFKINK